ADRPAPLDIPVDRLALAHRSIFPLGVGDPRKAEERQHGQAAPQRSRGRQERISRTLANRPDHEGTVRSPISSCTACRHSCLIGMTGGIGTTSGAAVAAGTSLTSSAAEPFFMNRL